MRTVDLNSTRSFPSPVAGGCAEFGGAPCASVSFSSPPFSALSAAVVVLPKGRGESPGRTRQKTGNAKSTDKDTQTNKAFQGVQRLAAVIIIIIMLLQNRPLSGECCQRSSAATPRRGLRDTPPKTPGPSRMPRQSSGRAAPGPSRALQNQLPSALRCWRTPRQGRRSTPPQARQEAPAMLRQGWT
eukprot:scaffold1272_cov250-Pinguiococcus_pyrenoidosus.AAC.80